MLESCTLTFINEWEEIAFCFLFIMPFILRPDDDIISPSSSSLSFCLPKLYLCISVQGKIGNFSFYYLIFCCFI